MGRKSQDKLNRRVAATLEQQGSRPDQQLSQGVLFEYLRTGPMPDADQLARYGEVLPGMPQTLLEAYVDQGKHRRSLERVVIINDIVKSYLGMGVSAALAGVIVWRGTGAILAGNELGGAASVLGTLASLVWVFLRNRATHDDQVRRRSGS